MSKSILEQVMHHVAHQAGHARQQGKKDQANAMAMIAFGIFLLPLPIIGVPLLIWGLVKLFSSPDKGTH